MLYIAEAKMLADRGKSEATRLDCENSGAAVSAPIVRSTKEHSLPDAVAALDVQLTEEQIKATEGPYTLRMPVGY